MINPIVNELTALLLLQRALLVKGSQSVEPALKSNIPQLPAYKAPKESKLLRNCGGCHA